MRANTETGTGTGTETGGGTGAERRAVAFVGLGGMGSGMAHALLEAGFPLTVHNRTASRAEPLTAAGAVAAATAGDAVDGADVVVVSLADEAAVEEVVFGALAGRLRPGALLLDTSTVSPGYSRDAAGRLAGLGVRRVEACVVGNPLMARAGKLRVFTAGDPADAEAAGDVLAALGREVRHLGATGNACVLKLAFNVLLGVQVAALAEAVTMAEGAGLPREELLDALTGSGFSAPTLDFRAGFMRSREYAPAAFRTALMAKDLRLALDVGASGGAPMPVTTRAADRYRWAAEAGRADQDAAAIVELPG